MKNPTKEYIESISLHFGNEPLKKELVTGSDRVMAILACSIIDLKLRRLLEEAFINDKKVQKEMFDGIVPLSSLSSKIKLAYLLKLISKQIYEDLEVIRAIRNQFAHNIEGCGFEDIQINKLMDKLNLFKVKAPYVCSRTPNRAGFLLMIMLLEPLLSLAPSMVKNGYKLDELLRYEGILDQLKKKMEAKKENK